VNWEAISAIVQIVGALAVVISLIYLAREVRQKCSRAAREGWTQQIQPATTLVKREWHNARFASFRAVAAPLS
jgi:hypothetical protein